MAKEINIRANVDTKKAERNVKELNKEFDNTNKAVDGLANQLDKMTGGMITSFKGIASGTKSAVIGMKTLKGAIAATGIGLLVIAVASLVGYFTNTQAGADKLNQVFKTIGATIDVLVDRISTFGSGLFEIMKGNFSEGLDILAGSFKGVAAEIMSEATAAYELEKALQRLQDREIEFIKVQAMKQAAIEKQRLLAEDESKSDKERADALRESIKIQNELTNEQIKIAKEKARIIREQTALGESTREEIRAQAEAEANVIRLESERDRMLRSLTTRLNAFTKATKENTQSLIDSSDLNAGQLNSKGFAGLTPEQDIELQQNDFLKKQLLDQNKNFAKESLEIEKNAAAERMATDQMVASNKAQLEQSIWQLVGALAAEGSKEAKGIAAAQVVFDTIKGIQSTFANAAANPASILFPGYPFAQAGISAAFGYANVKKIMSAPTKGASSVSSPTFGGGGGSSFSSSQTVPNIDVLNQGVGGNQNATFRNMRAYVIQQDISDEKALTQRLNDMQSV